MKVYIAGPMRGIPEFNYPAFYAAAAAWERRGWDVVNPADLDIQERAVNEEPTYEDYMRRDITELLSVDAIALLPGWQRSEGANVEVTVAKAIGLEIYDAVTFGRPAELMEVAHG